MERILEGVGGSAVVLALPGTLSVTASRLPQRLGAECLGMAFLLATVVGSSRAGSLYLESIWNSHAARTVIHNECWRGGQHGW
jgi:hypothetical protein